VLGKCLLAIAAVLLLVGALADLRRRRAMRRLLRGSHIDPL
jgi:hypothetical protein